MLDRLISTDETCAVIFGASAWPRVPQLNGGASFKKSADDFLDYLCGQDGLGLRRAAVLSLFDSALAAETQLDELSALISANPRLRNLIVYYVGHGAFAENSNAFYLMLRSSRPSNPASWLTADALSRLLKSEGPFVRTFLIIDSCFSGAIAAAFQSSPAEYAARMVVEEMPGRGTIVLCSSASNAVSMAPAGSAYTMFSGALLSALKNGSDAIAGDLTFADIRDLAWANMREAYRELAVRPVLHEPLQDVGELRNIPAFPNKKAPHMAKALDMAIAGNAAAERGSVAARHAAGQFFPFPAVVRFWARLSQFEKLASFFTVCATIAFLVAIPFWLWGGGQPAAPVAPAPIARNQAAPAANTAPRDQSSAVDRHLPATGNTCGDALAFEVHGSRLGCRDGSNLPYLDGGAVGIPQVTAVKAIVLHETETTGTENAGSVFIIAQGRENLTGPLAHILIARNGEVIQTALLDQRVSHVGKAGDWKGVPVMNSDSIGVMLEGSGSEFPPAQMKSARAVVAALMRAFHVTTVVGHKEVALPHGRKNDPEFDMGPFRKSLGLPV